MTIVKQYVNKQINLVGNKSFVLAKQNGLIPDFFIYQGTKSWPDGQPTPNLGIEVSIIKKLVD
jgi:hypothetical protein